MLLFALRNLSSRPARSILALLGLTVAIAGMVGLFSVAAGLDDTFHRSFHRLGGMAIMQPGAPIPLFSRLPANWVTEIRETPGIRVARPELWARANSIENQPTFSPPRFLFGTDIQETLKLSDGIYRDDIIVGRFLGPEDIGSNNTVISRSIAKAYRKQVGDTLRIEDRDTRIVGLYESQSILLDVAIILDAQFMRELTRTDPGIVSSVYVELDPGVDEEKLAATLEAKFVGRAGEGPFRSSMSAANVTSPTPAIKTGNGLLDLVQVTAQWLMRAAATAPADDAEQPGAETAASSTAAASSPSSASGAAKSGRVRSGIEVRSIREFTRQLQNLSSDLDLFLWLLTLIGVVIALLSILNTMLMSVTERMIEFGVLRANGWTRAELLQLICWESAILGLVGGLLGCLIGWIATHILNALFPAKLHLFASPGVLLFSLTFSTFLGVIGGLYPAIWAVRMSPMAAIRRG